MYTLPDLPYEYNSLEPYIDEQTMRLHHDKHHAGYVKGANAAIEKLDMLRKSGDTSGVRDASLSLSFNLSGHNLHSLFWKSMCPETAFQMPAGKLSDMIDDSFGSYEAMIQEFKAVAMSVEGSGWATLMLDEQNGKLLALPIEKHNLLGVTGFKPILALDVWEHAYYLKYQNDRKTYVDNFEKIINWGNVSQNI